MTVDIQSATNVLKRWVLDLNAELAADDVDVTTPLLSERLVTSLQITELLFKLEELRGSPVDISRLKPGAFKDIQTIVDTFLVDG